MTLSSDNGTTDSVRARDTFGRRTPTLTVTEKLSVNVQCIVKGGYPPPSVEVFLGREDVTDRFTFSHVAELTGAKGLRTIVYHTKMNALTFTATADDDGKRLKCISAVPGLQSNVSFVKLNVLCKCLVSNRWYSNVSVYILESQVIWLL